MNFDLRKEDHEWAQETWEKLQKKLERESERVGKIIPYIPVNGRYEDMGEKNISSWTNGFWSGILWLMYHGTGKESYAFYAEQIEERLDQAMAEFTGLNHDVGFMWLHTAVANYRLKGNEKSRKRGLHAAGILAGRYQPVGGYLRAWNQPGRSVAIIDCLMNLPLLYWAAEEEQYPAYRQIAMNHADMALKYLIRSDGSCNHIVEFDPITGEYLDNPAGQGYASGSSWTRGQSWAIYGMALSYRYTGKVEYLAAAKKVAHYFCANAALNDYGVVIDFRAPEEPLYYDTTAAVCAACGLLEIAEHTEELERSLYLKHAIQLLKRIDKDFCCWDLHTDSIVSHGSARYNREDDREVPIIYGDYFFLEGVLRLLNKAALIW